MASSPNITASFLDRMAGRFGSMRHSYEKARRGGRFPPMPHVAEHGRWNMPNLSISSNQLKTYEQFSAIFRAVSMIAQPASLVPLSVYEWQGEDKIAVANHDFEKLMRRPNPVYTDVQLLEMTIAFLELTGNAYWYIAYDAGRRPAEIWPMRPDRVRLVPHPEEFVSGYVYTIDGQDIPLEVDDVVHFKRFHPRDDYVGMSAISTLAYQLVGDQGMVKWNANFFNKQRAIPAGLLNAKEFISDPDFKRLKDEFYSQYGGTERRTMITRGGPLEWHNIGLGQQEMQFLEGREFTLDEIMGSFGIPAGKYKENATEANAKEANVTFKGETLWPKLVAIARQVTHSLISPAYGEQFVAEFEDVRPEDKRIWLDEVTVILGGTMGNGGMREPVLTRDEIRETYFDLEKFPEEEKPEVPDALQPFAGQKPKEGEDEGAGGGSVPAGVPAGPPGGGEQEKAADTARWQRKAIAALKRGKEANVAFETLAIPPHERLAIRSALEDAETAEEVKAAFVAPFRGWEGYP